MKTKIIKAVSVVAAMACLLCFPVKASATAQQGTNGTELEVVQAQQLEIQLGQAWTVLSYSSVPMPVNIRMPSPWVRTACCGWKSAAVRTIC